MTAKEYLNQAYKLDRQAEMLLAKADKLRESLYGRGVSYDGSRVKSGAGGAGVNLSDTVAQVIEYEEQAERIIEKLVEKRIEIEHTIAQVPDEVAREVLERRYLLYQPWETYFDKRTGEKTIGIDEAMSYSARQIYRIHGKALLIITRNVSECQ